MHGSLTSMTPTPTLLAMSFILTALLTIVSLQQKVLASTSTILVEQTHSVLTIVKEYCVELVWKTLASS